MPYTLKIKIRKSRSRTRRNIRRHTQKRTKGNANLIVDYNGVLVREQNFTKSATTRQPAVKFTGEPGKLYTLVMWDPDVPSQAQPGYAHWIAINLQGPNNIASNELLSYQGPAPPSGTGTHRYFFGLFEQEGYINPQQLPRTQFNINKFVQENNLKKVTEVFMKVAALNG